MDGEELGRMLERCTVSELNELKKSFFNKCDFTKNDIYLDSDFGFLCSILKRLDKPDLYTDNYKKLYTHINFADKWPYKFTGLDDTLSTLTIPQLYSALSEFRRLRDSYNQDRYIRIVAKIIKEKEVNEKKKEEEFKNELFANFDTNNGKIIKMMFEYLEKQNEMLIQLLSDNAERYWNIKRQLDNIRELIRGTKERGGIVDGDIRRLIDDMHGYRY